MTKKRPHRTYTDEFIEQVVQLYFNGRENVILFVNTILLHHYLINGLNSPKLQDLLKKKIIVLTLKTS